MQAEDIASVDLVVHSLVLELTGKKTPKDGLEGKFSVYHSAAAGIIFGRAGEDEYSDEIVRRADVIALRDKVHATRDDSIAEDAAKIRVTTNDGRTFEIFVEHAIGSTTRPMSDAQLRAKFAGLVAPVLGTERGDRIADAFDKLPDLRNVAELVSMTQ